MSKQDIAIRVENLSKQYTIGREQEKYGSLRESIVNAIKFSLNPRRVEENTILALDEVSFEVNRGEVVGIIGPNGAGKSTLLKILSRITKPTRGQVRLRGRVGSLLEVGTGFHPELTGRENIFLNGAILGMHRNEIEQKFDQIVSFSEIEQFLDTPVKRYSSGMYVRLAFAVAAHLEPEILLVDEVLAVGDAAFQKKCLGKMGDVAQGGRTVLFVSHQLAMINTLCQTTIFFDNGKLILHGDTQHVVGKYLESLQNVDNHKLKNAFPKDPAKVGQIIGAEIHSPRSQTPGIFDVFDPIILNVEYIFRKPVQGTAVNLRVKRNGVVHFVSFDTDNQPQLLSNRPAGHYITRVQIPSPLKSGQYTIDLSLGRLNIGGVDVQSDALSFYVDDLSFDTSTRSYSSKRPGVLVAHLDWETERVNDS